MWGMWGGYNHLGDLEGNRVLCCKSAPSCSRIEQRVQTAQTSGPVQLTVLQHLTAYRLALESAELVSRDSSFHLWEMLYSVCWLFCCTSAKCGLSQCPFWESRRGSDREIWLGVGQATASLNFPSP